MPSMPPKSASFCGGFPGPHLKHGLLGTTRVYMPNGISLGSTVFAHTDGPRYNSSNKTVTAVRAEKGRTAAATCRITLTHAGEFTIYNEPGDAHQPKMPLFPVDWSPNGSTLMAVGRSQLLARWPGTHSRILSGIQRAAQTVLGVYLKGRPTCSRVTSASSALGVLNDSALYKSTHALTHSHLTNGSLGPSEST